MLALTIDQIIKSISVCDLKCQSWPVNWVYYVENLFFMKFNSVAYALLAIIFFPKMDLDMLSYETLAFYWYLNQYSSKLQF